LTGNRPKYEFDPDYAVTPGRILDNILESKGMSKAEFAARSGLSPKHVSQILHGKASVTPQTSIQFERVLGISADTWDNLERNYQRRLIRLAERQAFAEQESWLKTFPLKSLMDRGILKRDGQTADMIEELLAFLGVASIKAYQSQLQGITASFRRSEAYHSDPNTVAVWLRLCELSAAGIATEPYERSRFSEALQSIRSLTRKRLEVFLPLMKSKCREAGVALVIIEEIPGTRLSGATRWLTKDKALIMLSLRHKADDHFWFSFFHEAAHILLHQKSRLFLDNLETPPQANQDEQEANKFAQDILIPRGAYKAFVERNWFSKQNINDFARRVDIAPGVVVGRLQHEKRIDHSWCNMLKRRFEFQEDTGL